MPPTETVPFTVARARKARAAQTGDAEAAAQADRDLEAAREERYLVMVEKILSEAPKLTPARRVQIAAILFAPSTPDGGAVG